MVYLHTQIEIAAPPGKVREVLLDFSQMPSWLHGPGIRNVQVKDAAKTGTAIEAGDVLITHIDKTTFEPVVLVNDSSELKWRGSIPYIFTGDHSFQFKKSETNEGGTTFVNEENFSGALSFLMLQWVMGASAKKSFEALNGDLKRRVEGLVEEGK
ncbi:putative polyketide cyclase/dehydrase, START-like domain superfamily [Septoria linicola]|nr:putative polyketide cyclase/dehydrase, START-like domain superfamily [Septoria linicola]